MTSCEFCIEFGNSQTRVNSFYKQLGLKTSRVLLETENFVVFPGLGPMVPGYLLIIPQEHYFSIAQLPAAQRAEFDGLKQSIRDTLASYYVKPVFYEHGSLNEESESGCCIYHAHLHALPTGLNLIEEIKTALDGRRVESIFEAADWLKMGKSYLYFETQQEEKFVFTCSENMPSQYIRRLIAKKLGKPDEWDWQLWDNKDVVLQTLTDLSGMNW